MGVQKISHLFKWNSPSNISNLRGAIRIELCTHSTLCDKCPNEAEVVNIINSSVLHEAQVLIPHHLLYRGRHLVTEQSLLLTLMHQLGQLHQTVS